MFLNQIAVKTVMASRYGCVCCDDRTLSDFAQRFVKRVAVLLHRLPNRLQSGERTVTFIHVQDAWRDAQRFQRPHAAYAQNQLLTNPRAIGLLGAVDVRGDEKAWRELSSGLAKRRVLAHVYPRRGLCVFAPPLCVEEGQLADGLDAFAEVVAGL